MELPKHEDLLRYFGVDRKWILGSILLRRNGRGEEDYGGIDGGVDGAIDSCNLSQGEASFRLASLVYSAL